MYNPCHIGQVPLVSPFRRAMKASWVVLFNRLFEIIDQRGECYFSGPRFISKVREIDPYFPDYHQYISDRNKTGKSTSRKSYFYDILLSFEDEGKVRLLNAILKEVEGSSEGKVRELRSLVHGIALAPSATVHHGAWNADRLNECLAEIDNCIAASNHTRAVTLVPGRFIQSLREREYSGKV